MLLKSCKGFSRPDRLPLADEAKESGGSKAHCLCNETRDAGSNAFGARACRRGDVLGAATRAHVEQASADCSSIVLHLLRANFVGVLKTQRLLSFFTVAEL